MSAPVPLATASGRVNEGSDVAAIEALRDGTPVEAVTGKRQRRGKAIH